MQLISALKDLGLSEYEAKALVTLVNRGDLSAKEIATFSNIPRTSVYDVMNSLLNKGLVESYDKPLKFKAMDYKELINNLTSRVKKNLNTLEEELPKIESASVEEIKVYRGDVVLDKIEEFIKASKEKITVAMFNVPDEILLLLKNAPCEVVNLSPNVKRMKVCPSEKKDGLSEIKPKPRIGYHGIIMFDGQKVMMFFKNGLNLGVVGEGEGFVSFYKMFIELMEKKFEDTQPLRQ